ncbi:hypothetical protein PHO31112_02904 [Pandoraea horticolens]|uniref:Uncharacterized protein n=1 Tax=Pandoraea horticolens TaxID=2508298 RepID=A0A5E4VVZ5_9BURK|nr:hypothetical protein [Pandoraea horticolens]VVE16578.1 hypothetical protein PHO31112_02904 [Pandoraea horticolens]
MSDTNVVLSSDDLRALKAQAVAAKSAARACELGALRNAYAVAFSECADTERRTHGRVLHDAADHFAALGRMASAQKAMRLAALMVGGK